MNPRRLYKVIACEIAFREICHCAARCPHLLDLEFVTQGLHDFPRRGVGKIQERIDAVPAGRYEAILLGYALCGNIIQGIRARHTPLVIPRAHDCITFFVGSRERYARLAEEKVGTYFYTSGWLECLQRRGERATPGDAMYLPGNSSMMGSVREQFEAWVARYGEEKARFLMAELEGWSNHYHTAALIDFDFTRGLGLEGQVRQVCERRGWKYDVVPGDVSLLQRWVDGDWNESDFLVVPPGQEVNASYDERIVTAKPVVE